jgi:parallel beta-helix repeat protein
MQESLDASLVRIRTTDGRVVGAGFLVRERHILTCAHVVSQALGLPDSHLEPPQEAVLLDFPLVSPQTLLKALVVQWCPPLSDGRGDIAGLELQGDPPTGAEVVRFSPTEDVWKHDFNVLGFPEGLDDGVWTTGRLLGRQATNWLQIEDVKAKGFAIAPGFSGTPVWDTQLQGVVGMVVAASRPAETRTAFVIPVDVLAAAWPLLAVPQGQPRNPYKGLHPFTQRDAADFFGREAVVEKGVELVNSLVTEQPARSSTRLLTILGPSGAGKSSLFMAGLLPKLQQGALPGSKQWVYLDPRMPGKHPLEALASTLKPHFPDTSFKTLREDLEDDAARGLHLFATQLAQPRGTRVVLLVDQFEELFTQTESEDERQRFIRLLLTACSEARGPLVALLTLRADFYDRPMQYPELYRLIEMQHLSLLAIEPNDLRRMMEQPAALPDVQVAFEGDLVPRLLADVQGQIGALPLLQFTLDQLFQRRNARLLTLAAYRELGGVKGALARQAEETYASLPSDEHRRLSRALFVRLIDPGATEQDTTRRRAALSEFALADPIQTRLMQESIDTFISIRLLTTNETAGTTTIEVSHEALIREWPRLAGWLREAREDIPLQQAISEDVVEWERRGKPRDRLYHGSQLKEAQAWARRNTLSGNEVAFLRAGAANRVHALVSIIVVLLLVVSSGGIAGWFYLHQSPDPTRVTNLKDDGLGSLRWAIANAPAGSTINFDASLHGTILLSSDNLDIAKDLTIRGPGSGILSISSGTIINNRFFKVGFGVNVIRGFSVTIAGLTFKDSATEQSIINNQGTLILSNSTVSDNTSFSELGGGGIYNAGRLTLNNSTVSGNATYGSIVEFGGGGIFNWIGGRLTLNNSTIAGNSTASKGGGIVGSTLTLSRSTIADNTASHNGGGIYIEGGTLTLSNSTVSGNTAGSGGGIFIRSFIYEGRSHPQVVQADLNFCTIYGNMAPAAADIAVEDGTYSSKGVFRAAFKPARQLSHVRIGNSIVADDPAHPGPDIFGVLTSLGYNLLQGNAGATFNPATSKQHGTDKTLSVNGRTKLFAAPVGLRDNGGPTRTYALAPGSPALDQIPLDACHVTVPIKNFSGTPIAQYTITTDQRGMKRPDGNERFCDIGAYEYVDSG